MYLFLIQEQIYPLIQEIVNLPNNAFDVFSLKSSRHWPSSDSAFCFYTQCHVIQNHSTNQNQLTGTRLSVVYKHWANKQFEQFIALPLQVLALWKTRFLTLEWSTARQEIWLWILADPKDFPLGITSGLYIFIFWGVVGQISVSFTCGVGWFW